MAVNPEFTAVLLCHLKRETTIMNNKGRSRETDILHKDIKNKTESPKTKAKKSNKYL